MSCDAESYRRESFDVVILGGGLAGLCLARQLLRETDRSVLLVERRERLPPEAQKVGESLVQLGGFYLSKVLDLEEHLLDAHYMKYNLRFYWPTPGQDPSRYEGYSQSFIRGFSNIASYQVDRNRLEGEILRRNLESPRFELALGAVDLLVNLAEEPAGTEEPHRVAFRQGDRPRRVEAGWVVDTTGRNRLLARRKGMARKNRIRHGAFFWWVEGRVNPERLTDLAPAEVYRHPQHRATGHLPPWLATLHFMGDGLWFWVIPLRGKTSLGLVFDRDQVDASEVFSVEKATRWVCQRFPLFARDLPQRKVLGSGGLRDFSYDCAVTLSPQRWAVAGEAGRFSDPLYSPGSDLIAIYNTLIVDAIEAPSVEERSSRCRSYESLMRAVYEAYIPSYADGYPVLGDPEIFALKYGWELAVYFVAFVFPFINGLFTDRRFVLSFLRFFGRLGPLNRGLQELLAAYHRWKKGEGRAWEDGPARPPAFFDFLRLGPLARAETTFYEVGVDAVRAREVLALQLESFRELAHFALAHVAAVVVGKPELSQQRAFVAGLDVDAPAFDPARWQALAELCREGGEPWPWSFEPAVLASYLEGGMGPLADALPPAPARAEEVRS